MTTFTAKFDRGQIHFKEVESGGQFNFFNPSAAYIRRSNWHYSTPYKVEFDLLRSNWYHSTPYKVEFHLIWYGMVKSRRLNPYIRSNGVNWHHSTPYKEVKFDWSNEVDLSNQVWPGLIVQPCSTVSQRSFNTSVSIIESYFLGILFKMGKLFEFYFKTA